jgi:hypothetical protein
MPKPAHALPLEARQLLWQRVWDRLLAAPPDAAPPTPGPTRDGRPADPLTAPASEDRPA